MREQKEKIDKLDKIKQVIDELLQHYHSRKNLKIK